MVHPGARALPGYGAGRVFVDATLTGTFDEWGALGVGLLWLAGLLLAVGLVFRATVPQPRRATPRTRAAAALPPGTHQ